MEHQETGREFIDILIGCGLLPKSTNFVTYQVDIANIPNSGVMSALILKHFDEVENDYLLIRLLFSELVRHAFIRYHKPFSFGNAERNEAYKLAFHLAKESLAWRLVPPKPKRTRKPKSDFVVTPQKQQIFNYVHEAIETGLTKASIIEGLIETFCMKSVSTATVNYYEALKHSPIKTEA